MGDFPEAKFQELRDLVKPIIGEEKEMTYACEVREYLLSIQPFAKSRNVTLEAVIDSLMQRIKDLQTAERPRKES